MRWKIIFLFIGTIMCLQSAAQNKYTLSGQIKDEKTGEALIGANVAIKEMPGTGTMTNESGFYSVTLPEGRYTVIVSYLGYKSYEMSVDLKQNMKLNSSLTEEVMELEEVVITREPKNANITQTQPGVEKIDIKEANKIPVLFGEKDILKTIQLMPGIKPAGEGNAGFYVRGGGTDQNLILLDGAPVYNASHLLGFFSVFNSDAIQDVTVYKGGMPAQYGGRLSSILDIKMKEGNVKKFGVSGGIGLISSRLTVEGPIVKDKGSFSISARRSYADLFLKLSPDSNLKKSQLYFYDINAKASYSFNDNNKVFLTTYLGRDVLGLKNAFGINWGNATGSLRWNHIFNDRLISNTYLITTNYSYNINIGQSSNQISITSRIRDYMFKEEFQYDLNKRNIIKFGVNSIYHRVVPGDISSSSPTGGNTKLTNKYAWENAAYISHEFRATEKLNFVYGMRLTAFSVLGPGNFFDIDKNGQVLDSATYNKGQFVKTYVNLEPRFAASYVFNERTSVKASYTRNVQNLHLLSNTTSGSPTDLWIPSSKYIKPEIADQVSLGFFRNFKENTFQFSTEVYYKNFQNQIDYKNGAQLIFNQNVETELLLGKGRAYGIEFFLKKKFGKFNGWIGYTLSRTERKFDLINNGNWYAAKQDRRHDISIVGIYDMTEKVTLSATWVYYTGNAVTFPSGKYQINGKVVNYYTERNGYRMPAYHRLDIAATFIRKKTEKFESSWSFSIYNVYARANAYTITFQQDPNDPSKTQAVKTTLFKMVPSFSYNFKF